MIPDFNLECKIQSQKDIDFLHYLIKFDDYAAIFTKPKFIMTIIDCLKTLIKARV